MKTDEKTDIKVTKTSVEVEMDVRKWKMLYLI